MTRKLISMSFRTEEGERPCRICGASTRLADRELLGAAIFVCTSNPNHRFRDVTDAILPSEDNRRASNKETQ
jgi:hypothetical protein